MPIFSLQILFHKFINIYNKYLFKYRVSLFLGILITIIARIFSLFAPRLIGNSLTAVERYILDDSLGLDEIKEELFWNIVINILNIEN